MAVGERHDPYGAFHFQLEIEGVIGAGFSEVSGLMAETEVEDYREGGVNEYLHRFAKMTRHPPLVLKRGITDSDALWRWHQDVGAGRIQRRDGRILLFDNAGEEKWRWTFEGAYPVKWTGPDFKADSSMVAFETVELVHRGFKKG
jgi:phage tail-like protein